MPWGSQRAAVSAAFGLARASGPTDPLQLSIACLTPLSQQSDQAPLLLLMDDAQWIDQATLDILGFIARRLDNDPVAIVFGSREVVAADLGPDCQTTHLSPADRAGSEPVARPPAGSPAGAARAAAMEQAAGNPLGLVELSRAVAANPAAAADWHGRALTLTERRQRSFTASALTLPQQSQRALLLTAADDNSELNLSYLSGSLRVPSEAWPPAQAAGLVVVSGGSAAFSHPLIRSAIYQAASPAARSAARWPPHCSTSPNGRPGSWPRAPPGPTRHWRSGWSRSPRMPSGRAGSRQPPPGDAGPS